MSLRVLVKVMEMLSLVRALFTSRSDFEKEQPVGNSTLTHAADSSASLLDEAFGAVSFQLLA